MFRMMCKSKIHRAVIKRVDPHYKGSIGIDRDLLKASDILPNEMVLVANVDTGARFETYVIEEKAGSGMVALYGAAAVLGKVGHTIIVISTMLVEEEKARSVKPKIIRLGPDNKIIK
jgi:aspartate 1-decarboxylase